MAVDLGFAMGLEPAKAIEYFESKGYKVGFRWQDVAAEAHAKAFTVAGVMKVDVLQDIRQALASSLKKGTTFEDFKKQLSPVLERKGWLGKGMIVDPDTGEIEGKRLTPRRLQTIFQTNMQSAYMAGRYASQMEQVDTHPYWEYVAVLDSRTRPAHRALAGSIYRYDDPFWQTFYPPNGYRAAAAFGPAPARGSRTSTGRSTTAVDDWSKSRLLTATGRSGRRSPTKIRGPDRSYCLIRGSARTPARSG